MLVEVVLFFLLVFMFIYWYVSKHFGYFKKMGICESPGYFPFGSKEIWNVWTGKGDAFRWNEELDNGIFANEKMYGVYSFGQRNLVVKE